jgi:hypothetical protein
MALGPTVLAVPDSSFVRSQMQQIFKLALGNEGATFTFDLPCLLYIEEASRSIPIPVILVDYILSAAGSNDLWGTRLRAKSALAATLFRQGNSQEAFAELGDAQSFTTGFSGYMTIHLLSLINRRAEFGLTQGHELLLEQARQRAQTDNDPWVREQRMQLVKEYCSWMTAGPEQLELESVRSALSKMRDPDMRRAYKDFVMARWAWPPDEAKWEELKALLPTTLGDPTTLDALLGRLFGLRMKRLSDDEVKEAVQICVDNLMTAQPWEMGKK